MCQERRGMNQSLQREIVKKELALKLSKVEPQPTGGGKQDFWKYIGVQD